MASLIIHELLFPVSYSKKKVKEDQPKPRTFLPHGVQLNRRSQQYNCNKRHFAHMKNNCSASR